MGIVLRCGRNFRLVVHLQQKKDVILTFPLLLSNPREASRRLRFVTNQECRQDVKSLSLNFERSYRALNTEPFNDQTAKIEMDFGGFSKIFSVSAAIPPYPRETTSRGRSEIG